MNDAKADAKEIFLGALDCTSPEDLARYPGRGLRRRRGAAGPRRGIAAAHVAKPAAFSAEAGRRRPTSLPIAESAGTVIGPYKLLQQIGEGGMGVVFMAEQTEPVQRTVALKIIKPGMDTRQVIARFEAERQALAMMDHPNIARVLDAGTTDTGRPYFVMELVKGVPITEYCDEQHLPLRERLELFVAGLPGRPARPPEGHHPPRPQAVERAGRRVRRQAGAQGDRLRRGQGDRPAADRADAVHRSSARSSARWST